MNKLYINNEGLLLYCENVPEEPNPNHYYGEEHLYVKAKKEFESALELAKDNGVEFVDQVGVRQTMFLNGVFDKLKIEETKGKFYDLSGVSVEVKDKNYLGFLSCCNQKSGCYCGEKVAILISDNSAHSKEEVNDSVKLLQWFIDNYSSVKMDANALYKLYKSSPRANQTNFNL